MISADTAQQRAGVGFVAVVDFCTQDPFDLRVDRVFLLPPVVMRAFWSFAPSIICCRGGGSQRDILN